MATPQRRTRSVSPVSSPSHLGGHNTTDSPVRRPRSVSQVLRMSGEVSAYKQNPSSALESNSSHGHKTSFCQKSEGPIAHDFDSMAKCCMGGKCSFKFGKCVKCGNDEASLFGKPLFRPSKMQCRQLESPDLASRMKRPSSRSSGELAIYNQIPSNIVECPKSRNGLHHWKFGKCSYCQKSEGRIVHDFGAMANPGGEGCCVKGGKCMFRFAKCTKCGRNELERRPITPIIQGSSQDESEQEMDVSHKSISQARRVSADDIANRRLSNFSMEGRRDSHTLLEQDQHSSIPFLKHGTARHTKLDADDERCLPVGGGLRAVRNLSRANSCGGSDGSTTAGSDDEGPMTKIASDSSTKSASDLWDTFQAFSGSTNDMDGKHFAKLCKDCELLDKSFTTTDVDLAFAKAVKGRRRVSWSNFEDLLRLVAERKGVTHSTVLSLVSQSRGPILHGTCPESVRFHDDKSTYTGTHINGGPEPVPKI